MRFSPLALALGASLALVSVSAPAQLADDQIAPRSVTIQAQGKAAFAAARYQAAADLFETALAVDPRNRSAYNDLARTALKQKLFGQAIRLTNKALELEPTDRDSIALQGEAMVELGALPRARGNLAKLQKLCAAGCPQVSTLTAVIARGPAPRAPAKKSN